MITSFFDYDNIIFRLRWHLLIESDKIIFACFDQNKQFYLSTSHLEKKKNFSTFQLDETKTIESIFAFSIICFSV
jgi:hypothetical protein